MKRHQRLQEENRADIVVIAIWVKDLPGLYSAEDVAKQLGYPESGPKTSQGTTISAHRDEYLVEGDIAPDEHRILTIFEGGGPDRTVVFESSFYQITTTIPDEVFPGRRSGNALQDVEDEVRYRLGVRDAISGSPRGPLMGEIVYQSSEESFLFMGVFSVYCAICSGSLNRYELGSSNPDALKNRRARVARRVFWRNKGLKYYYDTDDEEKDDDIKNERLRCMQAADEHLEQASEGRNSNEDGEEGRSSSEESLEELYSYDPELLCEEDSEWFQMTGGLGFYKGHPKGPKYYIASVDYDDYDLAHVRNTDHDPDIPEDGSECLCYRIEETSGPVCFPFHWSCFQLLSRTINAGPDSKELDKRVLFDVMSSIVKYNCLELPYGDVHGAEQDWVCIPGEEYAVKNPLAGSAFQPSFLIEHCILEDSDDSASGRSSQLRTKILTDPFDTLPAELTSMVLSYLSGPALFAFLQASMAVRTQTQSQGFWQRKISEDMPWLWELFSQDAQSIDFRKAYTYFEKKTRPRYGMDDRDWLALANRRRIWGACEVLAEIYGATGFSGSPFTTDAQTMARKQLPRDAYTVGWISALSLELTAAKLMIDELHDPLDFQPKSDDNNYILGSVGRHNVVFLCLREYGTISAATAVATLTFTFTSIRFALMVGIGGGAPTIADVRLGDVVVSKPTGTFSGVVQYDFGKALPNGLFERTGSLNKPPSILLNAISGLDSDPITTRKEVSTSIQSALERAEATQDPLQFQQPRHDWLFESSYHHESDHPDCSDCDQSQLVKRSERPNTELMVHYGLIASGNQVIKDSETRDKVARDLGVICFEMEAAGIMDQCPALVIRGICDYCDSHKNKQWQGYSAVAAAAYAKQLLKAVPEVECHNRQRQSTDFTEKEQKCLRSLSSTDPSDDKARLIRQKGNRVSSTCSWFLDTQEIALWLGKASGMTGGPEARNILWLHGNPGTGKSTMAITLVEELPQTPYFRDGDNILAYFFCDTGTEDNRTAISILGALLKQLIWQRPRFMKHLMQKFTRCGKQLFTSFDGLWAVLMDISNDSGDTRIFCVIDALDECFGESQRTLLRQIDEDFGPGHANHVKPKNLHILITSRPYPEISQYLNSFYNRDLASYPAVADDLRKVIGEKARKLARLKKYTSEVNAQIEQILEEKADGTFLWVGIACSELEDIPSWKAVAALQELPRGLHSLYSNLLHSAIDMNKDDQPLITRMLEFLVIAREPPTVAGLSKACQLFVNESEMNRLHFTREVIGLCRLMIVIDGDLVRLLHKSVKDFLVRVSGKVDDLKANATLTSRCIDYFLAERERVATATHEFFPSSLNRRLLAHTRGDWFWRYSVKYWPEHASLAQDMFIVTREYRRRFFGNSEIWGNWCWHHSRLFTDILLREHNVDGFSILHVAARWNIAPLIAAALQSSEADSSGKEQIFIDDQFMSRKQTTPLEEAARHGHTNIMALLLSKLPNYQSIRPKVLRSAAANLTKGMELMDMLLKRRIQVTEDVISAAAGNKRLGKEIIEILFTRVEDKSMLITSLLDIAESNLAGRESLDFLLNRQQHSVVKALSGADTNHLITSAAKIGSPGFMSLILSLRGNGSIDMHDSGGRTPLFHAVENGHYEVAKILLDAGSSPGHTDKYGWHPWVLASHCSHCYVESYIGGEDVVFLSLTLDDPKDLGNADCRTFDSGC
ncbi:hypothetical protein BDW72DRAFT_190228 [Aspergillus terricola var. indicus]